MSTPNELVLVQFRHKFRGTDELGTEVEYLSSQATTYCKHMVDDDLVANTISYKQV
jgi:hypothetical protein